MTTRSVAASARGMPAAWPGWLALAAWAVHAWESAATGNAANLYWTCNVAALLVAFGIVAREPRANAAGVLMLAAGLGPWLASIAQGDAVLASAYGTHLGALAMGLLGAKTLGFPRGAWRYAAAASLGL